MTWLIDGCGWLLTWVSHLASLSILLALINTLSVTLRLCWLRRVEIELLRSVWRLSGCAKVVDDSWASDLGQVIAHYDHRTGSAAARANGNNGMDFFH